MDITLQFVTQADQVSRLIRWFTWGDFSHVDVVLEGDYLLGAHFEGGVQIRPPTYATWTACERRVVHGVTADFLPWLHQQVGKPYDWAAIFGLLWRTDHWQCEDRWFCSELVAAAFTFTGVPVILGEPWRISPRDLMLSPLLEKLP